MEENNNQQPQGLQIELKPEIGVGVYANLALITHSSSDFILDFTCMLPGMQKPQVRSRVVKIGRASCRERVCLYV